MNSFLLRKPTRSFRGNRCGVTNHCGNDSINGSTTTNTSSRSSLSPLLRPRRGRSALVATLHDALTSHVAAVASSTTTNTTEYPKSVINDSSSSSSSSSSSLSSFLSLPLSPTRLYQPPPQQQHSLLSPPKRNESIVATSTPSMIDEGTHGNVDTVKTKNYSKKSKLLLSPVRDIGLSVTEKATRTVIPCKSRTISTRTKRTMHSRSDAIRKKTIQNNNNNVEILSPVSSVKQRRSVLHKAAFHSKTKYTKVIKKNHVPTSKIASTTIVTTAHNNNNIISDDSSCADTYNDSSNNKRSLAEILPSTKFPKRIRIPTKFYLAASSTKNAVTASAPSTNMKHLHYTTNDEIQNPSALTLPSSKFSKRIRIPPNFYHATSSTTRTKSSVPSTTTDNTLCTESSESSKHDTISMPPLRPQRKRNQTDFFTPSNLSVMFQFRSNNESQWKTSTLMPPDEPKEAKQETSAPSTTKSSKLPNSNLQEKSDTILSQDMDMPNGVLSYEIALTGYHQRVTLGYCHSLSFGNTLESAILAIDRKLQHTRKSYANDIDDKEIMADLREYKRSLRAFSVYEDREKLASIREVQENLELWGRQYATMNVHSKHNKTSDKKIDNKMIDCTTELLLLEKRPIVFASGTRMMSRTAFKCQYGINCIYGCHCKTTSYGTVTTNAFFTDNANVVKAPIPLIQPFSMDDDNDDDKTTATTTATKNRATIDSLRELKSSLQFIAAYQEHATYFSSSE